MPKAPKILLSIKIGRFFFTKYIANDDFSEPPQRADSKNPIFFFSRFLGLGHFRGPGVRLGRILGVLSIELNWGPAGGLYRPPPPKRKTRQPLCAGAKVVMRIMLKLQGSTPMFLSSTCFQITSCCKKRGGGGRALLHVDWRLDRQLALG